MEGADHHHFAGAHNVGHGRVHLGTEVLEIHFDDRLPGFLHVIKHLVKHHLHNSIFRGRKLPALNLCVPPLTTEKVINQLEHQFGIHNKQGCSPQRANLAQIQAGGHITRVYVFAELHDLDATGGDIRITTQKVEQADAGVTLHVTHASACSTFCVVMR